MKNNFQNIYKDKKVFITGHTGFKGSWLSYWLCQLGADVTGYSIDIPTKPAHHLLLKSKIRSITGDVRNRSKFQAAIKSVKPDIIFHLAAQPLVRKSYEQPHATFDTNIIGTLNLLEIARTLGNIPAIVNITTDKCYENKETYKKYKESDPLGGKDPYSASKSCSEIITNSYRVSFFSDKDFGEKHHTLIASARAGNVIGGGDWAQDRLIPDIIKATVNGEKLKLRFPHAVRPWQHVLEPISGYLLLGSKLLEGKKEFATAWNFGPMYNDKISVLDVVKIASKYWSQINIDHNSESTNNPESILLRLDSSKAKNLLGWSNVWNVEETFQNTIEWYKMYHEDRNILTEQNLDEYINKARKLGLSWTK